MVADRVALVRSMVKCDGIGLEVGPSHNPLFPKSQGFNVETLDYADADALRAKYANLAVNLDAIEPVDHVSDGRPMHDVVDKSEHFDYIFSSHAIEHVTDFVGYFKSCEAMLKNGGAVVLAIPDKRFIFDVLRFPSTTGEVLEAWGKEHERHSPARVFDFSASYATQNDLHTWDVRCNGEIRLQNNLASSKELFDKACKGEEYLDVHAWTLTPASFQLIMRDLQELGLIHLGIDRIVEDGTFEFYVRLTKEAKPCSESRCDLLRAVHREQLVSCFQILASTGDFGLHSEQRLVLSSIGKEANSINSSTIPANTISGPNRSTRRLIDMFRRSNPRILAD